MGVGLLNKIPRRLLSRGIYHSIQKHTHIYIERCDKIETDTLKSPRASTHSKRFDSFTAIFHSTHVND